MASIQSYFSLHKDKVSIYSSVDIFRSTTTIIYFAWRNLSNCFLKQNWSWAAEYISSKYMKRFCHEAIIWLYAKSFLTSVLLKLSRNNTGSRNFDQIYFLSGRIYACFFFFFFSWLWAVKEFFKDIISPL